MPQEPNVDQQLEAMMKVLAIPGIIVALVILLVFVVPLLIKGG